MKKTLNQTESIRMRHMSIIHLKCDTQPKKQLFKIYILHLCTLIVLIFMQFIWFYCIVYTFAKPINYSDTNHHHLSKILSLFVKSFNSFFISDVKIQKNAFHGVRGVKCTKPHWSGRLIIIVFLEVSWFQMRQLMCGFRFS